jgi:hypothetical protein
MASLHSSIPDFLMSHEKLQQFHRDALREADQIVFHKTQHQEMEQNFQV